MRFGRDPQSSSDSSYVDFSRGEQSGLSGDKKQQPILGVDDIEAPAGRVIIQLGGAENRPKNISVKRSRPKKPKKRNSLQAKAGSSNRSIEVPAGRVFYQLPEGGRSRSPILSAGEEKQIPRKKHSSEYESDRVEIPGGRRMLQLRGKLNIEQQHEIPGKTLSEDKGETVKRKERERRKSNNDLSVEIPAGRIQLQSLSRPNAKTKKKRQKKRRHASSSSSSR